MEIIDIEETSSTNNWLRERVAGLPHGTIVSARRQTAGRGQRGNSWEAEPGKNLTFSVLLKMEGFPANRQFAISEGVALAVVETLGRLGLTAAVKWPNDIYVGDRKICGILIEHSVMGDEIFSSVAGVGINVNQKEFFSDAPNPVSMSVLAGHDFDLREVLDRFTARLESHVTVMQTEEGRRLIHQEFIHNLWRGDCAFYPFRDMASGETFQARIACVEPDGMLVLETEDFREKRYRFKEVEFLLSPQPAVVTTGDCARG